MIAYDYIVDNIDEESIYIGTDGDATFAVRGDFVDLAVSNCGFGDNAEEAIKDLLEKEGDGCP